MSTARPVPTLPCDVDDQSAPPTSPGKPEVDVRSPRDFVTSPEAAADASPRDDRVGITCDAPASPIGAAAEQEREQASVEQTIPGCLTGSPYQCQESYDVTPMSSSSYFGESHVNRLQSFVDSVAAADEATSSSSWLRGRMAAEPSIVARGGASRTTLAPCADLCKPTPRLAAVDEPLDLSLKPPLRRSDPSSSVGELPFPLPVVPPLFPLLACRESWIAHWAALQAAASLQHSLLFPALAVTPQTGADTASGPGWMTSSSPRSSSSSSSPGGGKMAEERRRTALTAMESFVESSFKPRQQQQRQQRLPASSGYDLSHVSTNRKRRRHLGVEVTSSGDEDGGSHEEKRKRTEISCCRAGSGKDQSVSPRSDDLSPTRDDDVSEKRSSVTPQSKPEVNGEGEYLSCSTLYDGQDGATEHPLVSLEKFVGVSAPLFRSLAAPPAAVASNGISPPVCRTPGMPARKTPSVDVAMTSSSRYVGDSAQEAVTSRSMRGDVASGSLGRGFTSSQSLLCCNL